MTAPRSPWFKFYPADWRSDAALRSCSLQARAIWIDLLGLMHEAEPYGYLLVSGKAPTIKALYGLLNVHHKTLIAALKELSDNGVYSTDENGVIYSRRMVRDHVKALRDQQNGRRGGNPAVNPHEGEAVNPHLNPGVKATRARVPEARSQKLEEEAPTLRFGASTVRVIEGELFEPASKPKPVSKSRRQIPIDFEMPPTARQFAGERGFLNGSAEALWERFKNHHAAKGTMFASIEAGWRTWVLNEIKFNGGRHERTDAPGRRGPVSAVEAILSDIGRKSAP